MKQYLILAFFLLETACGNAPEKNYRKIADYNSGHKQTPLVIKANELPACTEARVNQLIFVKELDVFKVCVNDAWADVDNSSKSGQDLEPDKPVSDAKLMSASDVDLCAGLIQIACYFDGGEFITYSDGMRRYKGRIVKKVVSQIANVSGSVDSSDVQTQSMTHLPSWSSSSVQLLTGVTRNSVTSGIWLYFDAAAEQFSLIFDTNLDNTVSDGDEFLFHPDLTDF